MRPCALDLPLKYRAFSALYQMAWRMGLPFLRLPKRLRSGFAERQVKEGWIQSGTLEDGPKSGWQDVWIQAASGGEAYLVDALLKAFPHNTALDPTTFLTTTCTDQGKELLDATVAWCAQSRTDITARAKYFPFDMPLAMRRVLRQALPRVVVLLETELWPGLLMECRREDVPVLLINGRMSSKSLARYLAFASFFRSVAPKHVLAISEEDAFRFRALFGKGTRVDTMPNIKFDRVSPIVEPLKENPVQNVLKKGSSFVVLGSVREEEELDVLEIVRTLREKRPKTSIGLFPRHMHRVVSWASLLDEAGFNWTYRSRVTQPQPPGSIIIWDSFGELNAAYSLARAAFVGGSLRPLGGQNVLEPLTHGIIPCVGPHLKNFAWVAPELLDNKLLKQAKNPTDLSEQLVKSLQRPAKRESVQKRFAVYLKKRQGGATQASLLIAQYLEDHVLV